MKLAKESAFGSKKKKEEYVIIQRAIFILSPPVSELQDRLRTTRYVRFQLRQRENFLDERFQMRMRFQGVRIETIFQNRQKFSHGDVRPSDRISDEPAGSVFVQKLGITIQKQLQMILGELVPIFVRRLLIALQFRHVHFFQMTPHIENTVDQHIGASHVPIIFTRQTVFSSQITRDRRRLTQLFSVDFQNGHLTHRHFLFHGGPLFDGNSNVLVFGAAISQ